MCLARQVPALSPDEGRERPHDLAEPFVEQLALLRAQMAHLALQQDPQLTPGHGGAGDDEHEFSRRRAFGLGQCLLHRVQGAGYGRDQQVFLALVVPVDRRRGEPDRGGDVGHGNLVEAEPAELLGRRPGQLGPALRAGLPGASRPGRG